MQKSYESGVATHIGPESCGAARKGGVEACGRTEMVVVRFADNIVVGFHSKADADQFRAELTERMSKFHLELHPEKTRLLEFGPYAIDQRRRRGEGKPETFNFLGVMHIRVKKRSNGRFTVLRQTMHESIPEVGNWLQAVVRDTSGTTTVCLGTKTRCTYSGSKWGGSGIARCRGAVRMAASFRIACGASSLTGCLRPPSVILIPLRRMGVVT